MIRLKYKSGMVQEIPEVTRFSQFKGGGGENVVIVFFAGRTEDEWIASNTYLPDVVSVEAYDETDVPA